MFHNNTIHKRQPTQDWRTTDPSPWPLWSWHWYWLTCRTSQTPYWTPSSSHTGATGWWMTQWTCDFTLSFNTSTYPRFLSLDFSSVFTTIILELLHNKLTELSMQASTCQWITKFLTVREKQVRENSFQDLKLSVQVPHKVVCFPFCSSHCTSMDPPVKILKFADDTTVIFFFLWRWWVC